MATEVLAWAAPPSLTDAVDPGETYSMGTGFSLVAGAVCRGVQWRVPDAVSTPPSGSHVVTLFRVSDAFALASATFVPVPGGYQNVAFTVPPTLLAGVDYLAVVHTQHYVFRTASGAFPILSPSGNIVADESRLIGSTNPATMPVGLFNALYYVSPIMDAPGGADPVTSGSGVVGLSARSVSSAVKSASGRATLTATATAARSTARTLTGAGAVTLAASATRSSGRATAGRATLGVSATATRSGTRATVGTARVLVSAYGTQVRAGGGPRLVTGSRPLALTSTSRPGVLDTTTWG